MNRLVPIAALALLAAAPQPQQLTESQRALHALNRLGFGARPGDVERVTSIGVDRWIEQQLHPERIDDRAVDARLARYTTLQLSDDQVMQQFAKPILDARKQKKQQQLSAEDLEAMREKIPPSQRPRRLVAELSAQRLVRAAESERQLNEVLVDFWMNHFNVYAAKGLDRYLIASYERDTIRPRVWGRFEDLLLATAQSPAMLFYLDNARSRAGAINENYAREIMELHTLGVDGGYMQKDVTELARVFTGWSMSRPQDARMEFVFRPRLHDRGAKTVLGVRFAPNGGIDEGARMIRILARHPATAHHLATKLCQRLVSDTPSAALVERVAQRYLATNGDLRETVRAIVTSPEFWDARNYRAKVKSPFEYAVSAIRATGATIENPLPLARELKTIGEPLYFAQPPIGYSDKSEAWVNSGALLARLNFALALAGNKMQGVRVDVAKLGTSTDALARVLTGGQLTDETKKTIAARGNDPQLVAGLILGSPEFQRQ